MVTKLLKLSNISSKKHSNGRNYIQHLLEMLAGMIPEYKRNCVHARTSARVYISMRLIDNHSALWRLLILNFTHLELDKHSCRALSLITQIQEKVFGSSLPMTLFSPFLFLSCSLCVWVCVSFSL